MKASTTEEKVSSLSELDVLLIPQILGFLPLFDIITLLKFVQKEPLFDLIKYISHELKPLLTALQQLSVLLNAEANSNRFRLEGNNILTEVAEKLNTQDILLDQNKLDKTAEITVTDYSTKVALDASLKKLSVQQFLIELLTPQILDFIDRVNKTHYLKENNPKGQEVIVSHLFLRATLQLLANILNKPVRSVERNPPEIISVDFISIGSFHYIQTNTGGERKDPEASESKTSTPAEVVYMPGPLT